MFVSKPSFNVFRSRTIGENVSLLQSIVFEKIYKPVPHGVRNSTDRKNKQQSFLRSVPIPQIQCLQCIARYDFPEIQPPTQHSRVPFFCSETLQPHFTRTLFRLSCNSNMRCSI